MRRILFAVLLLLAGCSAEPPRDPVADYLADELPDGVSGTVIAARGDRIVYCKGTGLADRAARTPATCDTVYDTMSITKQFTAAAILKLEMMGKLRVGDRVGRHLGPMPADKRAITLHHLLSHTSGLVEGLGDDYEAVSRKTMLAQARSSKLLFRPGRKFHYSNVGYSLLAAVVEEASGQSYEEFLATHLFGPAGMTSTGYVLPMWDRRQVAVEYDAKGRSQGRPYEHPWASDGPHWNLRGNGGMLSTARDMFRWHRALSGGAVLSASAWRKLVTPYSRIPDSDIGYGYGWAVLRSGDGPIAWHNGGNDWSLANFARAGSGMTFWVSNDSAERLSDVELDLTRGILRRV